MITARRLRKGNDGRSGCMKGARGAWPRPKAKGRDPPEVGRAPRGKARGSSWGPLGDGASVLPLVALPARLLETVHLVEIAGA